MSLPARAPVFWHSSQRVALELLASSIPLLTLLSIAALQLVLWGSLLHCIWCAVAGCGHSGPGLLSPTLTACLCTQARLGYTVSVYEKQQTDRAQACGSPGSRAIIYGTPPSLLLVVVL